jgi:hypothetical protein
MRARARGHASSADRLFADSIQLVQAGGAPLGLGAGCDFTRIGSASRIIDAGRARQDLVPANQGVREPAMHS